MEDLMNRVKKIAMQEGVSEYKVFTSEIQRIFIEEFFRTRVSRGYVLFGGAGLKFGYREKRYTNDVDFGCLGDSWSRVNEALRFFADFTRILNKRIGYEVHCKVDDSKTAGYIFVNCPPLGGIVRIEVEFTDFEIMDKPEKIKIGSSIVLVCTLKEIKANKIAALVCREKIEVRDIYDIFAIEEAPESELIRLKLEKRGKSFDNLKERLEFIRANIYSLNKSLIQHLREDLGIEEVNTLFSDEKDISLISRVLKEIEGVCPGDKA